MKESIACNSIPPQARAGSISKARLRSELEQVSPASAGAHRQRRYGRLPFPHSGLCAKAPLSNIAEQFFAARPRRPSRPRNRPRAALVKFVERDASLQAVGASRQTAVSCSPGSEGQSALTSAGSAPLRLVISPLEILRVKSLKTSRTNFSVSTLGSCWKAAST